MNFERHPWPMIYGLLAGLTLGCGIVGLIGFEILFDLLQAIGWALSGGLAVPIPRS